MNRVETLNRDAAAVPVALEMDLGSPPQSVDGNVAPAIAVEYLCKRYGSHWAVDDVNFIVPCGWTIGLLGGNGAGKTTTIAMIMGLVIPTAGRVLVLGHDMARERHKVLRRMNFESPYVGLPARLTVRENLSVFGRLYGVPNVKTRIEELSDEFDLGAILDCATGRLSEGQKTRVSVAKALINQPEVLLLDEPTGSLDPERAEWVRGRLEIYRRRRNATILLSSHNMMEVERLCDFVIIMRFGRVIEMGAPHQLLERHGRDNLDELFIHLARAGGEVSRDYRIAGAAGARDPST
jgi:ABC-2 type transport system ATP-binding protein